mmetsp:Transcript_60370/g.138480  ORF Transcript_60370/g.138480 Transcript_60370/m.138480 type:complete len:278 (-) Transcript_60370:429-1262(-)
MLRETHQRQHFTPFDELAWVLAIRVLRHGAQLNEHLVEVVVHSRHVQLHLQMVQYLHLDEHQLLQVICVVAYEDEVVHVRDHHLLVLAGQAKSADSNQLKPLARDPCGRHEPPHEVNGELQRARDKLELVADDGKPVHQNRPHARVEFCLLDQEVETRHPHLVSAEREELARWRARRWQVLANNSTLLVDAIKVGVAEGISCSYANGRLSTHELAHEVTPVVAQHVQRVLHLLVVHGFQLLNHHVHSRLTVAACSLSEDCPKCPQIICRTIALALVV